VQWTSVKIVDPRQGSELAEDEVGEICIRGPSVASRYWGHEADLDATGFRRTGDLGFLHQGDLYVTGRLKSLILIRGRNVQAEDVELTAGESHPLIAPAGCAAVGIDDGEEETMHLLLEVSPRLTEEAYRDIVDSVRAEVAKTHGVVPAQILIVRRGVLPRTTSGKLQRPACRALLLEGTLPSMARWDGRREMAI
jgi:acyl-CoA synthetase (AMP-forming)/AMP-acid ligase II